MSGTILAPGVAPGGLFASLAAEKSLLQRAGIGIVDVAHQYQLIPAGMTEAMQAGPSEAYLFLFGRDSAPVLAAPVRRQGRLREFLTSFVHRDARFADAMESTSAGPETAAIESRTLGLPPPAALLAAPEPSTSFSPEPLAKPEGIQIVSEVAPAPRLLPPGFRHFISRVGGNVHQMMVEQNMLPEDLAKAADVSQETIEALLANKGGEGVTSLDLFKILARLGQNQIDAGAVLLFGFSAVRPAAAQPKAA